MDGGKLTMGSLGVEGVMMVSRSAAMGVQGVNCGRTARSGGFVMESGWVAVGSWWGQGSGV